MRSRTSCGRLIPHACFQVQTAPSLLTTLHPTTISQTTTPAGIELNPQTEPIQDPKPLAEDNSNEIINEISEDNKY